MSEGFQSPVEFNNPLFSDCLAVIQSAFPKALSREQIAEITNSNPRAIAWATYFLQARNLIRSRPSLHQPGNLRYQFVRPRSMQPHHYRMSTDELRCQEVEPNSSAGKAQALLLEMLKDGPRDAAEILATAKGAEIPVRTMQWASEILGVIKTKAGFMGKWIWMLPEQEKVTE